MLVFPVGLYSASSGSGLLDGSESDGTQLLTTDNQFASFTVVNGTKATTGTTTSPDGTADGAAKFTDTNTNDRHFVYYLQGGLTTGIDYTWSCYAKYSNVRYLFLCHGNNSGGSGKIYAIYDLVGGTVTDSGISLAGTGAAIASTSIAPAVNGFYKCTLRGRSHNSAASVYFQANLLDQATLGPVFAGDPTYAGSGSGVTYIWRPKLTT